MESIEAAHDLRGVAVTVTGAGGFIGQHLTRRLVARGAAVRAIAGPPGFDVESVDLGTDAYTAEIEDVAALEPLVAGAGVVVHLAGPPSVARSFAAPVEFARVHTIGTAAVLEASRRGGVRRIVFVSSAEVYGAPTGAVVAEDHPLEPRSPYGAAKLGAEALVRAFAPAESMEAVVLRPFSIYGPGMGGHSVLASIVQAAVRGEPVVVSDPRPVRDYCYVEDVVDATVLAIGTHIAKDAVPTYNVASGDGVSVLELASRVLQRVGRRDAVQVAQRSDRPAHAIVLRLVADVTHALDELGWRAHTKLDRGLEETISWFDCRASG